MGKFSYTYIKNRNNVQKEDEWDYALYSMWKPNGGMIDFKISSKKDLERFDLILDQVYAAGQENAKQQIRDILGV